MGLICGTERDNRANGTEEIMRVLSERMSKNMLVQSKNPHRDAISLTRSHAQHTYNMVWAAPPSQHEQCYPDEGEKMCSDVNAAM